MKSRRWLLASIGAMALTGCGVLEKPRRVNAEGQYCYRPSKRGQTTCTPDPVPTQVVEDEAKQFAADPDRLTVFVVRKRWADTRNLVEVRVDQGAPVVTVPESFVRLSLAPGEHVLKLEFEEASASTTVSGKAGEVRFVEIVGNVWLGNSSYRWQVDDEPGARERARQSRLVEVRG